MKAMILAAGIGSRLGALTHNTPKCLMPLHLNADSETNAGLTTEHQNSEHQRSGHRNSGHRNSDGTILQHVIEQLKSAGVDQVIINLHHFPDQITEYLTHHNNFGLRINYSYEPQLLNTGGGLKKARQFFQGDSDFFLHNADIYCTHDLLTLFNRHQALNAVATLGIMTRESTRGLYFNDASQLIGWSEEAENKRATHSISESSHSSTFAFSGISVCSSEIFSYMPDVSAFSIIESFLSAARATGRVFGSIIPSSGWVDIGTPERLFELQKHLSLNRKN
jgi:NDP-sugar pyrophosphorylase family protein